ncbi:hypothetical protein DOY81_012133 [Sarcophaga bullata]|nr:hypothetical protein DOY81_012133 [Sarcophaga bullata]
MTRKSSFTFNVRSFSVLIAEFRYERNVYFYILLTWVPDQILYRHLYKIFDLCLKVNVNNVVVIEKDFLFPRQLMNYYGCTLNVSAYTLKPYLVFDGEADNKTHLEDMNRLSGLEGEILKLLAYTLNFKTRIRLYGHLRANGFKPIAADLAQGIAHIGIGGLNPVHDSSNNFTRSMEYHATFYNFVVRSDMFFGSVKQLINPFKEFTWLLLLEPLFVLVAVIQILGYFKDNKNTDC